MNEVKLYEVDIISDKGKGSMIFGHLTLFDICYRRNRMS